MLSVERINSFYGVSHILHDISLAVREGEAVALLGRNGAGKTTTLKSIVGLVVPRQGTITFRGEDITRLPTHEVSRRGIAFVPEDRQVFPNLTVYENLKMGRLSVDGGRQMGDYLERVFSLFPHLRERIRHKGSQLSGGEQQMLSIARGLGPEPKLLLVDEPTEGLMPAYVEAITNTLVEIQKQGIALILVEQNFRLALRITKRVYLIEKGVIRYEGASSDLAQDTETRLRYLGV